MIKKTLAYFWSIRQQFTKYFITGVSAVILDISSLAFFKEVLYFTPLEAIIVNQFFLLAYVFFVNKYWSFKSTDITHRQMIRFLILSGVNYLISVTWMWLWNERLGFNYLGVRIVNVALSVSWNFLLYKYWIYKMPQISQKTSTETPALD